MVVSEVVQLFLSKLEGWVFYRVILVHIVSDPGLKVPYVRLILALVGVIIALCTEVYFGKIPVPQSS